MNESNYKIEQVSRSELYDGSSGFKMLKVHGNIHKETNKFEAKLFRKAMNKFTKTGTQQAYDHFFKVNVMINNKYLHKAVAKMYKGLDQNTLLDTLTRVTNFENAENLSSVRLHNGWYLTDDNAMYLLENMERLSIDEVAANLSTWLVWT
tara:strand:- start:1267 stop:1716 length:450 start_codon:yes stop_codon:yes gene_type:complete